MHNISPDDFHQLQRGYGSIRVLLLIGAICLTLAGLIIFGIQQPAEPKTIELVDVQATSTIIIPSLMPAPSATLALTTTATHAPTSTSSPTVTPTATPAEGVAGGIGYSMEGRPLEVYRFGEGPQRRMIVAGIHGGYEENTVRLADELIEALRENLKMVPADKTLYILRVINADGLAHGVGAQGRANANGVDLNRNWDAAWQPEWPKAGCWNELPINAGAKPFSEPETHALAAFLTAKQITALISYHSAALGISAGGQPPTGGSSSLAQSIARVTPYSYPPKFTTCQLTGQLIDWAANQGIAAVDIELNNHTETDLAINLRVLKAFLQWEMPSEMPTTAK